MNGVPLYLKNMFKHHCQFSSITVFHFLQTNFGRINYIIDWQGDNQDNIIPAVGAGHWNDPDQVLKSPH